ncbi:chromosome partitioning protein ParA [Parageobacillus thermoglucosidasius]|uniref:ParA family protein n=1 Tax=Parageobacillus thermoglucosidasius TaxID=1426 RepID=UPI000F6195B6|nr:AAA family ATPase [Parageobacillus thermoglucosidasius]GCD83708.1 chromosome partitioning protein ParA [Parageobacillus thermoglucosidasius]
MPGKVISFINMKGGVGKTTLTVNIADKLAEQGEKVLVIDMDPQFNSTQTLLLHKVHLEKLNNLSPTSKQNFSEIESTDELTNAEAKKILEEIEDEVTSTSIYDELVKQQKTVLQLFLSTSIVEKPDLIFNIKENLDIIPGDLRLSQEITGDTSTKVEVIMNFLDKYDIRENYNYVLIDCPPTWSVLTHSSLFASDYYVIPSKVDLYSSIGIKLLENQIKEKLTDTYTYKKMGLKLKNLGIIFTLIHRGIRAEMSRIEKIKSQFPNIEFFESLLPHMPSVPTRLTVYSDVNNNDLYSQLINSIENITQELIDKISIIEEENNERQIPTKN